MASHQDVPSRYKNVRYKSDLYLEEVPTEAYVRETGTFPAVGDDHESIVIDNGTSNLTAISSHKAEQRHRNFSPPRWFRIAFPTIHQ